jgi:hypothetical protein
MTMTPSRERGSLLALVALTTFLAAPRVFADTRPQVTPSVPQATESYGIQVALASVGTVVGSIWVGSETNLDNLVFLAPTGAPIVHLAHGNPGRALGSLLLHTALPVLSATIGYGIDSADCVAGELLCGLSGLALGAAVGETFAIILDAGLLARNVPTDEREAALPSARTARAVTPSLAVNRDGGMSFGLCGAF